MNSAWFYETPTGKALDPWAPAIEYKDTIPLAKEPNKPARTFRATPVQLTIEQAAMSLADLQRTIGSKALP